LLNLRVDKYLFGRLFLNFIESGVWFSLCETIYLDEINWGYRFNHHLRVGYNFKSIENEKVFNQKKM
jgi:hypothetical protein